MGTERESDGDTIRGRADRQYVRLHEPAILSESDFSHMSAPALLELACAACCKIRDNFDTLEECVRRLRTMSKRKRK